MANNWKRTKDFIFGDNALKLIYLIALVSIAFYSFFVYDWSLPTWSEGDTYSYLGAKVALKSFQLNEFRTSVYPLFLLLTQGTALRWYLTLIAQVIMFLFSIPFLYSTLKRLTTSSRLIFVIMLIYVIHPSFIYVQSRLLPESICISTSTIYIYFLVRYIKYGKIKDCCLQHVLMIILIFTKPAFLFLTALSLSHLVYFLIYRKQQYPVKAHLLLIVLSLAMVGGYASLMNKKHGVFGISTVSDINLYWMLRQNNLLDLPSIQNENLKNRIIEKSGNEYKHTYEYFFEAQDIIGDYSWNELHLVVQKSLEKNTLHFLFGEKITEQRLKALNENVGFVFSNHVGNDGLRFKPFYKFSCYHLLILLSLYALYIIFHLRKSKPSIVLITFIIYVLLNLFTLYLTAPENYDRLIMPSLTVILIIIMQMTDQLISIVKRKPEAFELQ